jgi:uncharacterized protein
MDKHESSVIHDITNNRYAFETAAGRAVADYVMAGNVMRFTHTGVPRALEGKGYASRLIAFALNDARKRGLKVRAECSFVEAYIARHPEYADLLG